MVPVATTLKSLRVAQTVVVMILRLLLTAIVVSSFVDAEAFLVAAVSLALPWRAVSMCLGI